MDYLANLASSFGEPEPQAEPEQEEEAEDEEEPIPSFYIALYQATEAVALGELELDQWMVIWQQVGITLERMAQGISSQVARLDGTFGPEVRVAGQLLIKGLEDALDALSRMGDYLDDQDPEHLNEGWGDLMDASHVIARATQEFQTLRNQLKPGGAQPPLDESIKNETTS